MKCADLSYWYLRLCNYDRLIIYYHFFFCPDQSFSSVPRTESTGRMRRIFEHVGLLHIITMGQPSYFYASRLVTAPKHRKTVILTPEASVVIAMPTRVGIRTLALQTPSRPDLGRGMRNKPRCPWQRCHLNIANNCKS